jgi:hypothetical protein
VSEHIIDGIAELLQGINNNRTNHTTLDLRVDEAQLIGLQDVCHLSLWMGPWSGRCVPMCANVLKPRNRVLRFIEKIASHKQHNTNDAKLPPIDKLIFLLYIG